MFGGKLERNNSFIPSEKKLDCSSEAGTSEGLFPGGTALGLDVAAVAEGFFVKTWGIKGRFSIFVSEMFFGLGNRAKSPLPRR